MRDATAITVINELTARGAKIKAYGPKAMIEAKDFYLKGNSSVEYKDCKYSVLNGCDALILLTEWKEFRSPDFEESFLRSSARILRLLVAHATWYYILN
jgi:UDPglucose 6-dehydrogenase